MSVINNEVMNDTKAYTKKGSSSGNKQREKYEIQKYLIIIYC